MARYCHKLFFVPKQCQLCEEKGSHYCVKTLTVRCVEWCWQKSNVTLEPDVERFVLQQLFDTCICKIRVHLGIVWSKIVWLWQGSNPGTRLSLTSGPEKKKRVTNCCLSIFRYAAANLIFYSVETLYRLRGDCQVSPRFPVLALFTNHNVFTHLHLFIFTSSYNQWNRDIP